MCEEGIVYIQKKTWPFRECKIQWEIWKKEVNDTNNSLRGLYTTHCCMCIIYHILFRLNKTVSFKQNIHKTLFSRLREHRNRQKWNLRVNFHSGSYCIDFHDIWWLLKEPFVLGGKPTEWVYLLLVYLVTALVPSLTACLASSPGRSSLMAVWISRELMVDFLL